jgi:hypothetical protein
MKRTVCQEYSCPAKTTNKRCRKHASSDGYTQCETENCDNHVYLHGKCITCKYPLD